MDTRYRVGLDGPFTARQTRSMTVPAAVADADTWALAANVTPVKPTSETYLTVWDGQTSRPPTSNINVDAGGLRSASAFVPIDGAQQFATYNYAGASEVALDVVGQYEAYPPSSADAVPPGGLLAKGDRQRPGPVATDRLVSGRVHSG